ncbi:glycoside hydrolase superfamily [Lophiotrema nucula]|uniref:Glycoside hydrolase superfamily n=1 Tax=Lophiotrema nucula TaxID=690887 RepID=A0A6A5ZMK2_9PLEO|nr:glycoside hydrolase superfamily [Lophiotrema nucula]
MFHHHIKMSCSEPSLLFASRFAAATIDKRTPAGFVATDGTKFVLNGKSFYFAGSNAYYFPFDDKASDVEAGMTAAKKAGLNVFRTWGFNDRNRTLVPGGLLQYGDEGAGATPNLLQWWANGTSEIDLTPFDKVVNAAHKTGIKLIFYSNPKIKSAFKKYVKTIVTRYANSSAIMAWELANEPRCRADGELSWGGEGGLKRNSTDSFYNGYDGGDSDTELALQNVDFGTFHSYPDLWSKTVAWTDQWIKDHAEGRKVGKPMLHEEYGWLTASKRQKYLGTSVDTTRAEALSLWQATSLREKMSDLYWQFGFSNYSYGRNKDDDFTIFLDDAKAQTLVYRHSAAVNALNNVNATRN